MAYQANKKVTDVFLIQCGLLGAVIKVLIEYNLIKMQGYPFEESSRLLSTEIINNHRKQ